jgi:hypothetical protein
MINIIEYKKALKELKENGSIFMSSLGTLRPKRASAYIWPEAIIKVYEHYKKWMKSYKPKLP